MAFTISLNEVLAFDPMKFSQHSSPQAKYFFCKTYSKVAQNFLSQAQLNPIGATLHGKLLQKSAQINASYFIYLCQSVQIAAQLANVEPLCTNHEKTLILPDPQTHGDLLAFQPNQLPVDLPAHYRAKIWLVYLTICLNRLTQVADFFLNRDEEDVILIESRYLHISMNKIVDKFHELMDYRNKMDIPVSTDIRQKIEKVSELGVKMVKRAQQKS